MKKILFVLMSLIIISSCSTDSNDEELIVEQEQVFLHYQGTRQIVTNKKDLTYSSQNPFVATVSDYGLITGGK